MHRETLVVRARVVVLAQQSFIEANPPPPWVFFTIFGWPKHYH
jgi:hypothetical protein